MKVRAMFIGAHIKTKPTYVELVKDSIDMGANTFAFFLRPPRGGKLRALDQEEIEAFERARKEAQFGPIVAHAPYIYNLAAKDSAIREKTVVSLTEDLERINELSDVYYNLHPGSHVGQGTKEGIKFIQEGINTALSRKPHAHLLLETMAGKGSEVGGSFEELAEIIEGVDRQEQIGVCLDTCHTLDAGYEVESDFSSVLATFQSVLGMSRLKAIHLNDSKFGRASKKDRHAALGFGALRLQGVQNILRDEHLAHLPIILETPNDIFSHKDQISLAKYLISEKPTAQELAHLEVELEARYPALTVEG